MKLTRHCLRQTLLAAAFLVVAGWCADDARATTLVFVHGQTSSKRTVDYVTNKYWTPGMLQASTRNFQGGSLVITYDGRLNYWDAATDVAAQVNNFLNYYPNERLVFVCHSYGGVVTRWIMCNSNPAAPYYNYAGANYARIAASTNHVITLASPHGGSEAANVADQLTRSGWTRWLVSILGFNEASTRVMTTSHLVAASQTWLNDSLRPISIYTVAGTYRLNHSWHGNDTSLQLLSTLVPFATDNDGMVATWSAHYTGAPGGDWFNTIANHDHNRKNDDPGYLGNAIGQYGW
jgi:pimeloyl-ACP methyl ester carboxylesterase